MPRCERRHFRDARRLIGMGVGPDSGISCAYLVASSSTTHPSKDIDSRTSARGSDTHGSATETSVSQPEPWMGTQAWPVPQG